MSAKEKTVLFAAAIVIVLLGFTLRAAYHLRGGHPDEVIAIAVVGYMRQSGDWDTNWAKADLDPSLRYDQYNFSSYHYGTYFFYRFVKLLPGLAAWRSLDAGFAVYRFFSVALAAIVVGQTFWLARRFGGNAVALGAGALCAVAPLLVQDAHYIRPEAFTTVLTLAVVALCWPQQRGARSRALGAAFVVGLLVACKVSMLLLAWLPFVPLLARWRDVRRPWLMLVMLPLAMVAGFAAGAPGAIANPATFINGVRHLANQYAGAHPPHSHFPLRPVGDILGRYFLATLGWPMVLAGLIGAGTLVWRRQWTSLLLLAGPVAIFAGYFATRSVFFERNLSHILPLFLILAALGMVETVTFFFRRQPRLGAALAAVGLVLLAATPAAVTERLLREELSGRASASQANFESELRARHPDAEWHTVALLNDAPLDALAARFNDRRTPVLLRVTDYNDDWTAAHLPLLAQRFQAEALANRPGTFPDLPACTLHTYHRPHERYFLVTGPRGHFRDR